MQCGLNTGDTPQALTPAEAGIARVMKAPQSSHSEMCEQPTCVAGSQVFPGAVGFGHRCIGGGDFSIQLLLKGIKAAQVQSRQGGKLLLLPGGWGVLLHHLSRSDADCTHALCYAAS